MQSLEKRLAALESQIRTADANVKVVLVAVLMGETGAEALARAGCVPDDPGVMCVLLIAPSERIKKLEDMQHGNA